MLTSSRRSLSYPNNTTRADSSDVPRDILTLVNALELDVVFSQGTHASRPAAGAGAPAATGGGRLYWETDTSNLFYDTGSAWVNITPSTTIAPNTITTAMIQANAITSALIASGAIVAGDIAAGTITAALMASALFPSQGAGASVEAFRALGTGAGLAAAGTHGSQHDILAADPAGYARHSTRLRQSAPQSIPTGFVDTVLLFDTEDWDTDTLHSTVTNTSRITIPTGLAGLWRMTSVVSMANPAENGNVAVKIRKNGTTILSGNNNASAYINPCQASVEDVAAVADYYEMLVAQDHVPSHGAVNTATPAFFIATLVSS